MYIKVSNLKPAFTNDELKNLFSQHGEVSTAEIAVDGFTGQSRCFAFVEMENEVDGQKAIEHLNNTDLNGQLISLQIAKPIEIQKGSYKVGNPIPFSFKRTNNKRTGKRRF